MSSAGNDIVALHAIDPQRTHRRPFYSKILSDAERAFYDNDKDDKRIYQDRQSPAEMPFETFVWLLWSIKESVYKYLKRTEPGLVFSPTKILVRSIEAPLLITDPSGSHADPLLSRRSAAKPEGDSWESRMTGTGSAFYRGIALFESRTFYFRSKIHPEFISTLVDAGENFENIWWGTRSIDHSDYPYQSTAVRAFVLNRLNAVCGEHFQIGKSPLGYPIVLKGAKEMKIPVSFAHHGRYIAYSFLLANSLQ